MLIKTDMWGLWSPGIAGLGWVSGAVGLDLASAERLLADRRESGQAFAGECLREVALRIDLADDGRRVVGYAESIDPAAALAGLPQEWRDFALHCAEGLPAAEAALREAFDAYPLPPRDELDEPCKCDHHGVPGVHYAPGEATHTLRYHAELEAEAETDDGQPAAARDDRRPWNDALPPGGC